MAKKLSEIHLDLSGNALEQFLTIWAWIDSQETESITYGQAAVKIFQVGMQACWNTMTGEKSDC